MAKKAIVQVIDDIDGKVLDKFETVKWSVDGKNYEFDTSAKHAQQFRDLLEKYISVSRTAPSSRGGRRGPATATHSKEHTKAVREWAAKNGYQVSDRGRIPSAVLEAFEAAH